MIGEALAVEGETARAEQGRGRGGRTGGERRRLAKVQHHTTLRNTKK